ncbi:deoxyguanosinetriphosphate triphosphohydrolase [Lacihabitans sp. LS3-19]|uniref:deoxyguanosinetriphosphate triphosphohydrolase n=1 Tax=Lacihabitans sp. LS3-19 TaxID=2487335 RepID=UPI0020CCCB5F|nr:deoxyguanosinetriphosphate triphosphohydrolase [Lacihabitans sp. LS3-19]MCP9769370.1 deoxyguanosinetriphosphate triphosphohydrolase [Lacihabitans sp. LS3-19]
MNWETLYSNKRLGSQNTHARDEIRGDYMRDYDRVVFSSQFRRLQNKTQVFPLPGAVFVHNRLTHSLEVASVGRSLGKAVGERLSDKYQNKFSKNVSDFYRFELSDVIQTACLAHDIGNPPYGHFGEEAIRTFFTDFFSKSENKEKVNDNQRQDLEKFEGNASAFRILTTIFQSAGLKLTYTSLVSIIKYPCDSISGFNKQALGTKKSGFFDSEIPHYQEIVKELGLKKIDENKNVYARHPYVYLVEAADDICYRIIDLEDAFKLNVISYQEAEGLLLPLFENDNSQAYIQTKLTTISDESQKLSLLRAMLINLLTRKCTDAFMINEKKLLEGTLNKSLIDLIDEHSIAQLKKIDKLSFQKIYNHHSVVEKELAGYHVIYGLLEDFVGALTNNTQAKSQKILRLLPSQFIISEENTLYQNLMTIVDFISGMTDNYAMDLFRKIRGIQSPEFA